MVWFIGIGGILGSIARFSLGKWVQSQLKSAFPWGTWVINASGSFILGGLHAAQLYHGMPTLLYSFLGIGFCGAYTTFSTFGYETIGLLERGEIRRAANYVLSSVIIGIVCAWLGILAVRFLL